MNFVVTIVLSFLLHCMLVLFLIVVPVYTKVQLPQNQVLMVNLIEEQRPQRYKVKKTEKPKKPREEPEIEPPEPEEQPTLALPKETPKKRPKPTPKPTPQPTKKPKPTVKPKPKTRVAKKKASDATSSEKRSTKGSAKGKKVSVTTATDQSGIIFPFSWYSDRIQDLTDSNWKNPKVNLKRGEKLITTVKFTILRSGDITGLEVVKKSGNIIFDMAAIRAVKESSPYPSLPPLYMNKTLTVTMDFIYYPQK